MLTDTKARAAKPQPQNYHIADHVVTGLRLVIYSTGRKVFQLKFKVAGQAQSHTLGAYPANSVAAAREWAGNIVSLRDGGYDPRQVIAEKLKEAAAAALTCQQAWAFYFEHEASACRTSGEKQRLWDAHWRDSIGSKPLAEIKRGDISAVLNKHQKIAPAGVQQNFTTIRRFFRWCVTIGYERNLTPIEINPCANLISIAKTTKRDRVLSDFELERLVKSIETLPQRNRMFLRLLTYTGVRRREAGCALWEEFDLEAGHWTIPAHRSKNNVVNFIPLTDALVAWLKEHRDASMIEIDGQKRLKSIFVFPAARGITPMSDFTKVKLALNNAMQTNEPWTFHDIRRTVATSLSRYKVRPEVVEAVLHHVTGAAKAGVAGIYNRYQYEDEKKEALTLWESVLKELFVK